MKTEKGFTLLELLVVISIIGLLATTALASLGSAREKARDTVRIANLERIQNAIDIYFGEKGFYPKAVQLYQSNNTTLIKQAKLGTDVPISHASTVIGLESSCLDFSDKGFHTQADCDSDIRNRLISIIPYDPSSPDPLTCRLIWGPCVWSYNNDSPLDGSSHSYTIQFRTEAKSVFGDPRNMFITHDRRVWPRDFF